MQKISSNSLQQKLSRQAYEEPQKTSTGWIFHSNLGNAAKNTKDKQRHPSLIPVVATSVNE